MIEKGSYQMKTDNNTNDEVVWECPRCKTINHDFLSFTTWPLCENCDIDFDWGDLAARDESDG